MQLGAGKSHTTLRIFRSTMQRWLSRSAEFMKEVALILISIADLLKFTPVDGTFMWRSEVSM